MRRRGFMLLAPSALAAAQSGAGPSGGRPPERWLRVIAWVAGESPPGREWKAQVEGKPARVFRARGPESDLILFVILDLTGDLASAGPARDALVEEAGKLPPNAWPAVFHCQDGLHVLADPAPDRRAALEAIRNVQVAGRAGLLETVVPAARLCHQLTRKTPVRAAVLYVTDSNVHNYREDFTNPVVNPSDSRDLSRRFPENLIREKTTSVAALLSAYDAPVFVVHLAFLRDRLNEAYQMGLQQIAQETGGAAEFCRGLADIPGGVSRIVARAASHWAIDIEPPPGTPKTFTVQLAGEGTAPAHRSRFTFRGGKE
jgi:hypothetical protein